MKTKRIQNRCRLKTQNRFATATQREGERHAAVELVPSLLNLKRIMVPTDFSKVSLKALQYAVPFAERFGATICLAHVIEPAPFINDLPNVVLARSNEELAEQARQQLVSLAQKEIEELVPVNSQVRIGKPWQKLVELAKTREIDLIIIATHGRTGLKHALLGSTAEQVVRHETCPVLVVRGQDHEFV